MALLLFTGWAQSTEERIVKRSGPINPRVVTCVLKSRYLHIFQGVGYPRPGRETEMDQVIVANEHPYRDF
jgi:hypothetical protein